MLTYLATFRSGTDRLFMLVPAESLGAARFRAVAWGKRFLASGYVLESVKEDEAW